MKLLAQSLKDGKVELIEAPSPFVKKGHLLISTSCSAISSGTEKMLIDFGKSNLLNKAISQPERVSDALSKLSTDGIISTFNAINSKLNTPITLGYSNVGIVIDKGEDILDFNIGDRVVSNGNHAEQVLVPKHLCCKIPSLVNDEEASFAVIGAIGLQGIRLASPNYGERYLVIGLGIIGQIIVQLLKSNGCEVYAIDTNDKRCSLAKNFGINSLHLKSDDDAISWCKKNTKGIGFDGIIVAASSDTSDPVKLASKLARKKGTIVLVGSTKIELNRNIFYEKELKFQVSKSYGPGRYDSNYEENGNDYPISYVRWTENRNIEAILKSIEVGNLNIRPLISSRFDFKDITMAYESLRDKSEKMGIIITYKQKKEIIKVMETNKDSCKDSVKRKLALNAAVIGCGNYFSRVIIPILKKTELNLHTLVSNSSLTSSFYGNKFKFEKLSSDIETALANEDIDIFFIGTRHDSHGEIVKKCLDKGKHVFVEKPLCLNLEELNNIKKSFVYKNTLMVGFNRRFSPIYKLFKTKIKKYSAPKSVIYICNAGYLPSDHWLNDLKKGGGRMIGEACHFLDLIRDLIGFPLLDINLTKSNSKNINDTFSLNMNFEDGSIASIHYFSNGNKLYPKENLKVFVNNNIFELDNFKSIKSWENNKKSKQSKFIIDKGQKYCIDEFINSIKQGNPEPIPFNEIFEIHSKILTL